MMINSVYNCFIQPPDFSGQIRGGGERGFSLVEMMVALAVGMIVLIAILYGTTGSKSNSKFNQELARLQENGRVATTILEEDLRSAAYVGCGGRHMFNVQGGVNKVDYLRGVNAQRYPNLSFDEPLATGLAGSDILTILGAGGQAYVLEAPMAAAKMTVDDSSDALGPVAAGEFFLVTDCETTDLFAANSAGPEFGAAGLKNYGEGSLVVRYFNSAFFVRQVMNPEGTAVKQDTAGEPVYSLFRQQGGQASEIAEGVAAFRLCLGRDTNADGEVDQYVTTNPAAATTLDDVLSVRADLLLTSVSPIVLAEATEQTFTLCDGTDIEIAADKRLRKLFTTTVALRNRVR